MATDKKSWIVIASGERPLNQIAEELSQHGFQVNSTLDAISQIIVESDGEQARGEGLAIRGVADIVPMGNDIQLPDPGESLTW